MTNTERLTAREARLASIRGYSLADDNAYAYIERFVHPKTDVENLVCLLVEPEHNTTSKIRVITGSNSFSGSRVNYVKTLDLPFSQVLDLADEIFDAVVSVIGNEDKAVA